MEKQATKIICHSDAREHFDCDGKSLGIGNERALYYAKSVGKRRVYRDSYPSPQNKGLALFEFHKDEKATALCDEINKTHPQVNDLKPKCIS